MASALPSTALEAAVMSAAAAAEAAVDAQIGALDALGDDDLASLRRKRLAQLKADADARSGWLAAGHGGYTTVQSDKEFFEAVRGVKLAVAHFGRASRPCAAMEAALRSLAPRHLETKFIGVEAERTPFLAERLKVWMLPTLALLKDGQAVGYVVGLDGVAAAGSSSSDPAVDVAALEDRLVAAGVLRSDGVGMVAPAEKENDGCGGLRAVRAGWGGGRGRGGRSDDEDSDFD
jgi:hypothetical protein